MSSIGVDKICTKTIDVPSSGLGGTSNIVLAASNNETILEKILQERLLLVQQIAELIEQHEMKQEELANLEANALQQRTT